MTGSIRHPWPYVRPKGEAAPAAPTPPRKRDHVRRRSTTYNQERAYVEANPGVYMTAAYVAHAAGMSRNSAHDVLWKLYAAKHTIYAPLNGAQRVWALAGAKPFTGAYLDAPNPKKGETA